MKKIIAVLFVLGLSVSAFCEAPATAPAKPKAPVAKKVAMMKATGLVVSVDAANNQIVVSILSKKDKKNVDETFAIDANATISKAGKKITLAEIAAGEKVSVRYEIVDGKKIAKSIMAIVAKPVEQPKK
ncbi:MAG: hypothetical protein PHE88_02400 [Elusimicrobia bacterium]|nr:hypothetical protein [Elusimicrobiota bacterium]